MEEPVVSQLSPIKRTLLRMEQLEARLNAAESERTAPIAVVGMSCRFPGGVDSPEAYWRLLRDGVDAITEVPPERWNIDEYYHPDPETPGKMYARHGGFLKNVDRFDAAFFRITPREAISMDPQQRLLLEVSWEALENAQIPPDTLRGSAAGVFVGVTTNDYAQLQMREGSENDLDGYFFTGNPLNTIAGRVSYFLGLHGPSMALDTACSSSLVALHQACQSLRAGECEMALAGGVNLILSPVTSIAVSRTRALAPDGRAKTFDAAADGFVRSEGCGVVVLKKLSDALATGDTILAVIRGSAVNHDGASGGFTVPNGKAQEAVIRKALGSLAPAEVDYIEAHGTGTKLGDPIEVKALAAVFSEGQRDSKLLIGSVKTNLGHTEAAAGIAGVIKVILALRHGELPPHLHFNNPSPLIPWAEFPVKVNKTTTPWLANGKRRIAGVSAFGASGTNAHLVIEEAPPAQQHVAHVCPRPLHPFVLSAKSEHALKDLAERYAEDLARSDDDFDLESIAAATAIGRSHFRHRLGIAVATKNDAVQKLKAFVTGQNARGLHTGNTEGASLPRIAFLFTGQGSQYQGMGQEFYNTEPVFRDAVERCNRIASDYLKKSLLDVMYSSGAEPSLIDQTLYCQPALFTLEYALVELLKSWGIKPDAVMGHSVGEYAAACVAGVFSLEDGLRLIIERARLMQALPPQGGMAAVFADEQLTLSAIEPYLERLSVAAVNGSQHTVISGEQDALPAALEVLANKGVEAKRLTVSHAFHSPLIEPMLDEFEAVAAGVRFSQPLVPFVSNLTGALLTAAPDALYWRNHCREPVRFASGIASLFAAGMNIFVEIGPKPILTGLTRVCAPADSHPLIAPLLAPGADWETMLAALLKLYTRGAEIDWRGFYKEHTHSPASLPTYPFQRKRFWFKESPSTMLTEQNVSAPPVKASRRDSILADLRASVAALIQAEVSEVSVQLPFLEMGADSLVLVEAIREIENKYGLKLAIRRFFEDLSTIAAVADFVHSNLPEDALDSADNSGKQEELTINDSSLLPSLPLSASPENGVVGGASSIEQVLIEQNRTISKLMSQQMDLLRETLGQNRPVRSEEKSSHVTVAKPAPVVVTHGNGAKADEEKSVPLLPWGTPAEKRAQGLTPTQQQHLENLIERYSHRTRKSKAAVQQYRAELADSRATVGFRFSTKEMLYPIVGDRSRGSRLWDIDGNEYIDFTMGFGVHLFGHTPSFINEAVAAEFDKGLELGARSNLAGEVAERFVRITGQDRVAFTNSGTEAVMAAMRLARAGTGREKIVIFNHSYHGHADGTLAAARYEQDVSVTYPMAPGVPSGAVESVVILEYGTEEALATIRTLGSELAAVMVEPVQSRNPSLQPVEFLREVRKITEECGAALIFDEMITGFRVHPAGAQGLFGVQADLACYGKIIGGGLPLGIVAGRRRFMDGIDGGLWSYGDHTFPTAERTAFGGTFCQHPLAMAAARAVLLKIEEAGSVLQERLNERTARLAETLNRFFETEQVPLRVTSFGSMFRFEFKANLDLFFYHMLEKGIYIWEWRTCFLSTAHSEEDLETFFQAVKQSVAELRAGGFIAPAKLAADIVTSGNRDPARFRQLPLSEAQKQLWILSQIDPDGSLAYNLNATLELKGKLNATEMLNAVSRLSARHDALRTTVLPDGESQVVHEQLPPQTRHIDYSSLSTAERETAVRDCRLAESEEAFDLVKGPLFRALLIQLEPERYLLSLTAHHIVSDGTSMGLLLEELAQIYAGHGDQLPEPMQFPAYIELCAQSSATPEMNAQREFWLAQMQASELPALKLPVDRPRPAQKTYHGGRVSVAIARTIADELRHAARTSGSTLFMFLLAAFEYLLAEYSGQDEIITGIPVTGRPFPGSERLVGYCTHLLPLRAKLTEGATVGKFLQQSRSALLASLEHQDFPFAELIQHLSRNSDTSLSSLVSTVFNLEPVSALPSIAGLELSLVEPVIRFTAFDLSVNVIETGAELHLQCDYNTDLFDRVTIERLLNVYQTIAQKMATAGAQTSVSRLSLLPEAERRLLDDWNATATAHPAQERLHELFELQAATAPGKTALIFGDTRISYGELNERAERLAGKLVELGVGPEVLVGVCADRKPGLIVGLLAVLKAGGAYVPLDPAYPKARLQYIMEDATMPVILTDSRAVADLPQTPTHIIDLDSDWTKQSAPANAQHARRNNLSYVIYTSGSTGHPHGVAIEHRSVVEFLNWVRSYFTAEQMACVLAATSICFDLSIFEIFGTLSMGGTLVLAENALQLPRLPATSEITLVNTVPSVMSELLKNGGLPPSVNTVNLAGEPLTRQLVDRIYEVETVRAVYNLYGPSEDTTYSTATLIERADSRQPSIGRPLSNTRIHILGRKLELLPPGVTGEIYLAGAGLARGYLNNPVLTAERFISNPFSAEATARMYKTGDLARYRSDGNLEFLGRIDNQVKLRGFRIEPGETAAALVSHDRVDGAIVVVRGDGENRQLVAYITSQHPASEVTDELQRFLRDRLPEYMRPARFVVLREFPLLPNGKIDRKRLPDASRDAAYIPPQTEMQSALFAIWQEVLQKNEISARDSFFEIGGDSLSATRVVARIERQLNVTIELRDIFLFPTITELAHHLARVKRSVYESITALVEQPDYELSPAQKRFWIQDQLSDAENGGTLPVSFLFDGQLNVEAFADAFRALVARHEILRTVFITSGNEPRQKVMPAAQVPLHLERLDLSSVANQPDAVASVERHEALAELDLSRAPLLRLKLLKLSETRHVCVCTMHHIISDGWSAEVLLDELSVLYDALASGRPDPLEPLPLQYRDYAFWLNRLLDSPRGEQMKSYWLEKLGGAAHLDFRSDFNDAQVRDYARKTHQFTIPQALIRRLKSIGRRHGATLFMTLQASVKALLYRHTGQEDIVIGTPVAGRVRRELEGQVGAYLNVVALRDRVPGGERFDTLLERVRETTLDAYGNQLYPLDWLLEGLGVQREPGRNPVFDVGFTLQNQRRSSTPRHSAGLEISELPAPEIETLNAEALTKFWFLAEEDTDALRMTVVYNGANFAESTVRQLAEDLRGIVEQIAQEPDVRINRLGLNRQVKRATAGKVTIELGTH